MTTAPPPPPPPPRGISRTFILCLQFPIVLNHHTVGSASWQTHDSMLLYCTAMVAYVYQTPTFLPHYGDNCKSKITAHLPGYSCPAQGLGWSSGYKWLVHKLQPMLHFTWKFSSQPPPKNIMTPGTKYDIRWYIFQPISKYIPTPSLVFFLTSTVKGLN